MSKWLKVTLIVIGALVVLILVAFALFTQQQAIDTIQNTHEEIRERIKEETAEGSFFMNPDELDLPYEDVTVATASGMDLKGWYIPSQNGASVMLMHGFLELPYHMLEEAEMLYRYGYGSLLISTRAHNFSDGEFISFGCEEMEDFEAWYQYLLTRGDVDPGKIGLLGQSMGGSMVIQYASQNENIQAVVSHSAFSSVPAVFEKRDPEEVPQSTILDHPTIF